MISNHACLVWGSHLQGKNAVFSYLDKWRNLIYDFVSPAERYLEYSYHDWFCNALKVLVTKYICLFHASQIRIKWKQSYYYLCCAVCKILHNSFSFLAWHTNMTYITRTLTMHGLRHHDTMSDDEAKELNGSYVLWFVCRNYKVQNWKLEIEKIDRAMDKFWLKLCYYVSWSCLFFTSFIVFLFGMEIIKINIFLVKTNSKNVRFCNIIYPFS